MAAFGWSAGDIIASVQLVAKIAGALKETNGAKSDYRESIDFLFGLEITLQNLRTIAPIIVTPSQQDIIQLEAEKVAKPLSDFFAKVQKYDAALGLQSKRGAWRTAPKKLQWAMGVSKEVQTLRDRISVPISSLNILLQSQTLCAISQLKESLPTDISDKIASKIENAVSNGLKQELETLKDSTKNQQQTDRASISVTRYLKPQEVVETVGNCPTSSRLEQLIHDQSNDLKALSMSLTTIVQSQALPSNHNTEEDIISLRASMYELKVLFAKCMCLLALSLHELFNETLVYLGPQFLFFLLALKQFGSAMPRLLLRDSMLFEDVLGRQKYLPVECFQHYSVFSTFLRESFEGVPGQKYVLNRQYQLNDANNAVVDSAKWPQTVARREKVTMSVLLDQVNDEEMTCPRCWTSESVSKSSVNVQCSSCGLIYRAPTPKKSPRGASNNFLDSAQESSESSSEAKTSTAVEQAETPKTEDPGKWGRTTVVDFSATINKSKPSDGWLGDKHNGRGVAWDYEDLVHFKRVQIAEPERKRLPQSSAFNRLILVSARLRDETWKSRLIARSQRIPSVAIINLNAFVSSLELYSSRLSFTLKYSSFEFLSPDTGLNGPAPLWSQAWTDSTQLQEQSKELFMEALRICQELKHRRISNVIWGGFDQDSAITREVELATRFHTSLRAFNDALHTLSRVDAAWKYGGLLNTRQIESPLSTEDNTEFEDGVATSLEVTSDHIIVALDSGTISIFKRDGSIFGTLLGHEKGVWAMAAHNDILVTGGVDRDVRVWRISTSLFRESIHALKGHTSTIRCLKFGNSKTVVSGSRDTTIRIWNIENGMCENILVGHQASVRCLEAKGDIIVSGSYDSTARVWSISEGRCLQTLTGHFSQIYCLAFDGKRVVTGSLDMTVSVWDVSTGNREAVLHGHTSLAGHLQLRNDTLVTGGFDGLVRVWSLETMEPIHRLAAAGNSITSLRFDHRRILTGSSDGKVKVWDLRTGKLVRELGTPTDAVRKVYLEETLAVMIRGKSHKTIVEIWSFLDASVSTSAPLTTQAVNDPDDFDAIFAGRFD